MEQKKTLWIIAAVGLFLLVVLGAAMILYPPSARSAPAVATINPVERRGEPSRIPTKMEERPVTEGFEKLPENQVEVSNTPASLETNHVSVKDNTLRVNDLFVVSENTTVYDVNKSDENPQATTIDLNTLRNEVQSQPPVSNINITVNLPEQEPNPLAVTVIDASVNGESKSEANNSSLAKVESKKELVQENKKSNTDSKKTSTASSNKNTLAASTNKASTSKKTNEVKPAAPKPVTRFWVQVAAYSNKKTAENARTVLDNNKIPADIFTYEDNKDRLFYRVRVGPYQTKSEAEYWKSKIVKISEFAKAESYVTSSVD